MVIHDLRCVACGQLYRDVMIADVEVVRSGRALCAGCGGVLHILWLRSPAITGTETGSTWFKPGYNVQLGRSFSSFDEHQKYVKEKGFQLIGPDEYRRSVNASHEPEEPWDHAGFVAAAKRGWDETVVGGKMYSIPKVDRNDTVVVDSTTGKET
jgi:hypothetical protein